MLHTSWSFGPALSGHVSDLEDVLRRDASTCGCLTSFKTWPFLFTVHVGRPDGVKTSHELRFSGAGAARIVYVSDTLGQLLGIQC